MNFPIIKTILIVISVISTPSTHSFGHLDFMESCNLSQKALESQSCNTDRGLKCAPTLLKCLCANRHLDLYIRDNGRCETKVGRACNLPKKYPSFCVENSKCETNGFCACEEGYVRNRKGTLCVTNEQAENSNLFKNVLNLRCEIQFENGMEKSDESESCGSNAVCNRYGWCKCIDGFRASEAGNTCNAGDTNFGFGLSNFIVFAFLNYLV